MSDRPPVNGRLDRRTADVGARAPRTDSSRTGRLRNQPGAIIVFWYVVRHERLFACSFVYVCCEWPRLATLGCSDEVGTKLSTHT
jgi:hypothetical protein